MSDFLSFDDAGVVNLLDQGNASDSLGFIYAGSVIPSLINLGSTSVQYVYVGSKLFWPSSPIQLYTQLVAVSIFDTPGSYDVRVPSGVTAISIVAIGGGGGGTGSTQTVAPQPGGDSIAYVNGTKVVHAGGGGAGSKSTIQTNSGGVVVLGDGLPGLPGNLATSQFYGGGGGGAGSFSNTVITTSANWDYWNAQGGGGASILGVGTQQTGFGKGTAGIVGGADGQLGVEAGGINQAGAGGLYGGGGGGARDGAEGGAGGALAYVNNVSVSSNDTISIVVGGGGAGQEGGTRLGGAGAKGAIAIYWGFDIPNEFPYLSSTYINPLDYETYGESLYTTQGSYTWTCPTGVTSVSVVAVGGGGGAGYTAGGGGGLVWANDISVTPGNNYTIVVGTKGTNFTAGGNSTAFGLIAYGGGGGSSSASGAGRIASGGTYFTNSYPDAGGGDGGSGGDPADTGNWQGGGGAGGYTGNGGRGGSSSSPVGQDGAGGGGGGYYGDNSGRGGAGGVGLYGIKENGVGGQSSTVHATGGSGGEGARANGSNQFIFGGNYGGGGAWTGGSEGGSGAVRIIWPGTVRKFPDENVGQITNV